MVVVTFVVVAAVVAAGMVQRKMSAKRRWQMGEHVVGWCLLADV